MDKNYYQKYLTYKNKYLKLKNQLGGLIESLIISELYCLVDKNPIQIINDLKKINEDCLELLDTTFSHNKFINPEDLDQLNETTYFLNNQEIMNKLYLYSMLNYKDFFNQPGQLKENFFDVMIKISTFIHEHLLEVIKPNDFTIVLCPGDSPTNLLFIIKMLYPKLFSNPKIKFIEFPISGLTKEGEKIIAGKTTQINRIGVDYLKHILRANSIDPEYSYNFIVFDMESSGKTLAYLKWALNEINNLNQTNGFNIGWYLEPSPTESSIRLFYYQYSRIREPNRTVKIDNLKTIVGSNSKTSKYPDIYLFDYFKNNKYRFEGYDEHLNNLHDYLTLDDSKRCQYKLTLDMVDKYLDQTKPINEFLMDSGIDINSMHKRCNYLMIFIYCYSKGKISYNFLNNQLSTKLFDIIKLYNYKIEIDEEVLCEINKKQYNLAPKYKNIYKLKFDNPNTYNLIYYIPISARKAKFMLVPKEFDLSQIEINLDKIKITKFTPLEI